MQLPDADSELLARMDAAWSSAAAKASAHLACRPGCTECCHGAFSIHALDAARLRHGLQQLRQSDPSAAAKITQRAQDWIATYGADFPGDVSTGRLGDSEEDREKFEDFAPDAPCPVLDPQTGHCQLYAARPMTCRLFGPPVWQQAPDGQSGLGCCELCFTQAMPDEMAACAMEVPHDLESQILNTLPEHYETIIAFALR